jgi:hypothetical protein
MFASAVGIGIFDTAGARRDDMSYRDPSDSSGVLIRLAMGAIVLVVIGVVEAVRWVMGW